LADATGWIGQNGIKSWEEDGEENQKKGILKKDSGKKTVQGKQQVQLARIRVFL
jgi:hypothetical protein